MNIWYLNVFLFRLGISYFMFKIYPWYTWSNDPNFVKNSFSFHLLFFLFLSNFFWLFDRGCEGSFLNCLRHVVLVLLSSTKTKLLSLVVQTHALWVLIQTCEASCLLVGLDAFHFDHLGSRKDVSELDGASGLFLILNNFLDALFNWVSLGCTLIVKISLICVLVAL